MSTWLLALLRILLYIFSISLALGTWNPFIPFDPFKINDGNGFEPAQIISVLFIGFLLFVPKSDRISENRIELIILFFTILFSTMLHSLSYMGMGSIIFFLKFALVITLFVLLPRLFLINNKLLYHSLLIFSLVCAIIAMLYSSGSMNEYLSIDRGRVIFWGENPNSTSARYVMAFICIINLIIKNPLQLGKYRHIMWLFLPPIFNMVMASGSRGSFLILIICILIYLIYAPTNLKITKIIFFLFFPILIYQIALFYIRNNQDYSIFERLNDTIETRDDTGREELQRDAITIFYDYPIIGTGTIKFQEEMKARFNEDRTVHNLYVYVLTVSGFLGFIPFILYLFSLMRKSLSIRNKEPLALILFLYMFFLAYKTGGILTYILMWFVFAVINSLYHIEKSKSETTIINE